MAYKLENHSYFSVTRAEMVEKFVLFEQRKNLFGKWKWKPVYMYHPLGMRDVVSGDKTWARKIAKQYAIEVPGE